MTETDQYIEEFRKKDYSRFQEFYEKTVKQVYFTAVGVLKDKDSAEDIVQETYTSFLRNIDSYKMGSNVFAYLTVIARNKSINVYNRNKHIALDSDDELEKASYEMDVGKMEVEEILSLLKDDTDREIVNYHVICGYKFREIADILKIPLGTVLWRYNKAIKKLAKEVDNCEAQRT